jgi:L-ascorbate metabolism protein UlaG (beta-lactamase superfamily)
MFLDKIMYKRAALIISVSLVVLAVLILGCGWYLSNPALPGDTMIKAKNYSNGKFVNSEPTTDLKSGAFWATAYQFLFKAHKERVPTPPLPVVTMKNYAQEPVSTALRFVWLGHSSVLVELGGKRILIDPMLSERASFYQWAGPKRFQPPPIQARDLPTLDAVLVSHDHYDHLDETTIKGLAAKTSSFHVPLGLGAILQNWGVQKQKIHEYGWWDEHEVDGITIVATPARHFSGRGLFDRFGTLWCSWVVIRNGHKIFHSGDTGMTTQFCEIGAKYGPFDFTFVKMAAYNENWPDIHLNPEQAVETHRHLGGQILVPIHWGVFDLSIHSWYEPIERLVKAAEQEGARIITPKMGEIVNPSKYENGYWWKPLITAEQP